MYTLSALFFLLIQILYLIHGAFGEDRPMCQITRASHSTIPENEKTVGCLYVGNDQRSVDQVIRDQPIQDGTTTYRLPDIINQIHRLDIRKPTGDIKIRENGLAGFTNVEGVSVEAWGPTVNVDIAPNVFSGTPNLKRFYMERVIASPNTITAIQPLKDKLTHLGIKECSPQNAFLNFAASCSNLIWLELSGVYNASVTPVNLFRKSASTLKDIRLGWKMEKITSDTFRGMNQVTDLEWRDSGIREIEAGTFDGMPNLTSLDISGNEIRRLPDGLFRSLRKLKRVVVKQIGDRMIENLSLQNFSHVEDFANLRFY